MTCEKVPISGDVKDPTYLWSSYAHMRFTHSNHLLHCLETQSLVEHG